MPNFGRRKLGLGNWGIQGFRDWGIEGLRNYGMANVEMLRRCGMDSIFKNIIKTGSTGLSGIFTPAARAFRPKAALSRQSC